jgi:hypothetical protein
MREFLLAENFGWQTSATSRIWPPSFRENRVSMALIIPVTHRTDECHTSEVEDHSIHDLSITAIFHTKI